MSKAVYCPIRPFVALADKDVLWMHKVRSMRALGDVAIRPLILYTQPIIVRRVFRELVASCLQRDPRERPSAHTLTSNNAFASLK
jgi:hypothetical protein